MSKSTIRIAIFSVIFIIGAATLFGLVAAQVHQEGKLLTEQIEVVEIQESRESSYLRMQRIAEESIVEREALRNYFLQGEGDSVDVLNHIDQLAQQAGLSLKTQGLDIINENSSKWIEATFIIAGSQEQVFRFVKILETVPYVHRLTDVTMKALSSSEWEAGVTIQIQVLEYGS